MSVCYISNIRDIPSIKERASKGCILFSLSTCSLGFVCFCHLCNKKKNTIANKKTHFSGLFLAPTPSMYISAQDCLGLASQICITHVTNTPAALCKHALEIIHIVDSLFLHA